MSKEEKLKLSYFPINIAWQALESVIKEYVERSKLRLNLDLEDLDRGRSGKLNI